MINQTCKTMENWACPNLSIASKSTGISPMDKPMFMSNHGEIQPPPQMVKVQRNDTFLHGAGKSNHRLVGKMEGVSETQPITWSSCTSATVKLNYTTTSETMEVTGLYCFSRTFKSLIHSSVRPTIQVKWE